MVQVTDDERMLAGLITQRSQVQICPRNQSKSIQGKNLRVLALFIFCPCWIGGLRRINNLRQVEVLGIGVLPRYPRFDEAAKHGIDGESDRI